MHGEGAGGKILTCSRSDRGIRDQNEDACGVFSFPAKNGPIVLLAVADGLGGHPAGEIASSLAIAALNDAVSRGLEASPSPDPPALRALLAAAFDHANREVIRRSSCDPGCLGMGTTLVAAILDREGEGVAGNIGDSRAYLVGEGGILRITRDHSRVQEMVDQGLLLPGEAVSHPLRHIVTRVIGRPGDLPDLFSFSIGSSLLVLCSDGLMDGISEEELGHLSGRVRLAGLCDSLVESAREKSRDNITVVAACREREPRF